MGLLLSSCDKHQGSGGGQNAGAGTGASQGSGDLDWQVKAVADDVQNTKSLEADAEHDMEDGGKVQITGTCDDSSIQLEFAYFAKDKDDSAYETQGTEEVVHVPYRFDQGDPQEAISKTKYDNTADITFSYEKPEPSANDTDESNNDTESSDGFAKVLSGVMDEAAKLAAEEGPQDLRSFLHAQQARFELPLKGGHSEVVTINPQDDGFQRFVSACKIDLKKFDAEVAAQKAADKAAADRAAQEKAHAAAATEQAAAQATDAVKQVCTTGQGMLRVNDESIVENSQADGKPYAYSLAGGETVTPIADPTAVASGKCSVTFPSRYGTITGELWIKSLAVADSAPAPAAN
jgi:hypothetical protein